MHGLLGCIRKEEGDALTICMEQMRTRPKHDIVICSLRMTYEF